MEGLLFERSHGRKWCVHTDKSSILHTRIVTNLTFSDRKGWNSGAIDDRVRSKKKKGQMLCPMPVSCHFASSLSGLESCNSHFCIHITKELIFYKDLMLREAGRYWLLGWWRILMWWLYMFFHAKTTTDTHWRFFSMDALIKCCQGHLYLCVREYRNKVSDVLKNPSPACCFVFQQSLLSCIV